MSKSSFLRALNHKIPEKVPLYCTGYLEKEFLDKYLSLYNLDIKPQSDIVLNDKNYSLISRMGFDGISLWDFRRGKGGYRLNEELWVDGWGRIKKGTWYQNDGVFKDKKIFQKWDHLRLPNKEELEKLKNNLPKIRRILVPLLSIPGLFEKTWQSMGLLHFSKYLHSDIEYIKQVVRFFTNYIKELLDALFASGARYFLIADDCGYKQRAFLPRDIYANLFATPYKSIIGLIKEHRGKVILHADGNITKYMDLFIKWGFDALQSLEPNAGVDIFSLFKQYEDKICFIGNLDVSILLSYGTSRQVRDYVQKLIGASRKYQSPLIVSPTQQIHAQIDPKNIKTMIDTTKKAKNKNCF